MFNIIKKEMQWGQETLSLETGQMARQADGSVLATIGETSVLATVVAEKQPKPDIDFFPLTVHYQEKAYAAGKIPGGFFKRETKPSESEVLTSRLIDRPIRPLFADGFNNETQVICTVLSHDLENSADIVAMIAASAALTISGLPFLGPIGAARVAYINGQYQLNPTLQQIKDTQLDLVMAGTRNAVMMVESEADELSEEIMLGAVNFGHEQMQPVIDMILDFAEQAAKDSWEVTVEDQSELYTQVKSISESALKEAFSTVDKQQRRQKIDLAKTALLEQFAEKIESEEITSRAVDGCFKKLEKEIVRSICSI